MGAINQVSLSPTERLIRTANHQADRKAHGVVFRADHVSEAEPAIGTRVEHFELATPAQRRRGAERAIYLREVANAAFASQH